MKKLLTILFALSFLFAKSQYVVPRGLPFKDSRYLNFSAPQGYILIDTLAMFRSSDTLMKPLFPAIKWAYGGFYQWDLSQWSIIGTGQAGNFYDTLIQITDTSFFAAKPDGTQDTIEIATTGGGGGGGGGGGTVTSVATGLGLSGGTIITSGTIILDTASPVVLSRQRAAATYEPIITASNTVNQYWNGYKQFVTLNTDSIGEGSVNLFFTELRARQSLSLTTTGTGGAATYNSTTGVFNIPVYNSGTVTSVGLSMPSAFTVTNSPVTSSGTLTVTGAGTTADYIRGDGSLSVFTTDARAAISAVAPLSYSSSTGVMTTSMSTNKLIGRSTAGTGVMEEVTIGSGLSLSGGTLTATGSGGSVTNFTATDGNGFDFTVTNPTTTPTLTATTTVADTRVMYSSSGAITGAAGFTFNGTSTATLGVAGASAGTLKLTGNTSGTVTINTAAAAGTWSMTLPTTGGTNNYVLTTNGSGVTTWSNPTPALTSTQIAFGDGSNLMTSSANLTYASNEVNVLITAIGSTTPQSGLILKNTTAAAVNAQQWSPSLRFSGNGWTTNTGASIATDWEIRNEPTQSSNGAATLDILFRTASNPFSAVASLTSGSTWSANNLIGSNVVGTPHYKGANGANGDFDINSSDKFFAGGNLQLTVLSQTESNAGYRLHTIGEGDFVGGVTVEALVAPTGLTASYSGTAGSATYKYKVVAYLLNGGKTEASSEVTATTVGASVLSSSNKNLIAWGYVRGAYQYNVYRTVAGGTGNSGTTGLLSTTAAVTVFDQGTLADGTTPPTVNTTGNLGIGTATAHAALEVSSTTQGFLPPRMTTTQRDAIATPPEGSVIYNLTTHKLNVYTGSAWEAVTSL